MAPIHVSTFRYESRLEPRMALRLRVREIAQSCILRLPENPLEAAEERGLETEES